MSIFFNATQVYETISNVQYGTRQIKIECNDDLIWSCRVKGNFGLNKYQDVGPTSSSKQLQIVCFDDEDKTAFGEIEFSYYDEGCLRHSTIPVFYSELDKWLSIYPTTEQFDRSITNEYRTFEIKTNLPSLANIYIDIPNEENYKAFITKDNTMYLIKLTDKKVTVKLSASITNNKGHISILEFF